MKSFYLIVFMLINTQFLYSQLQGQEKIDSLLKELPKMKKDTNAVNLLSTLSFELYSTNPDKGLEYAFQGVKLAKVIDWEKGKAKCYNSLGLNYSIGKSDHTKALKYYLKALKYFSEIGEEMDAAAILHNIGMVYSYQTDYPKALEYYLKALKINEKPGGNKIWLANNNLMIGSLFRIQSDYPKALEYYHKALKINEQLDNKSGIASNLGNIGLIYQYQSDYPKALEFCHKALKINEEIGNKYGITLNLGNIGVIYFNQSNYPKALKYLQKAVKINEEFGNKSQIANLLGNMGNIYIKQSNYPKALEYFHKTLKIFQEIGNKQGIATCLGNIGGIYFNLSQDSVLANISEGTEFVSLNKDINLNRSINYTLQSIQSFEEIGELYVRLKNLRNVSNIYKLKGDYKNSDKYFREHIILKDSVFNQENNNKLSALEKAREDDVNRLKIEKQEILLKAKEDEKQLIILSAVGALFSVLIILTLIINQRRKSEKLLLNILPASIAKRLKAKEENIADDFEKATTVFIDLVGFTSFAKDKKASEVVKVLNKIFHRFDDLVKKHGLEKIKTMGDGYLAVAGVPDPDTNHCQKAINFALDVRKELEKFNQEMGLDINARIGLETGPLVAGVIGSSKFIYDIWGDSVNTASRMESTGTPGKIQITENVKIELEKQNTNQKFEKREAFEVKGKGLMQTYYLDN